MHPLSGLGAYFGEWGLKLVEQGRRDLGCPDMAWLRARLQRHTLRRPVVCVGCRYRSIRAEIRETVAEAHAGKIVGWVVEISRAAPAGALQFNVAEPIKARAVEAVRRRIPEAAGAKVEAKTPLSSHTLYGLLRMKRGQVAKIG